MYSGGVFVEKSREREEFGEVEADDIEKLLARDRVELVCQVEEDRCSSGEKVLLLSGVNIFLHRQLYRFDDEVRAVRNADSEVVGK